MKKKFLLLLTSGLLLASLFGYAYLIPSDFFISKVTDNYTPTPVENSDVVLEPTSQDVLGVQSYGSVKIPVLMYHNIDAVPKKGSSTYKNLFVTPSMFEQQMKYLKAQGYKTLTPDEFYTILISGKTPKQKVVLITFDDGSKGQYKYAYPILKKYGMTATFYIIADKSPITAKQLKEMSSNGMVIDSHTSTHRDLSKLKKQSDLKYELVNSKTKLEKITGKTIESLAYPGCVGYKQSVKILQQAGYKMAFSCGKSITQNYSYRYNLSRVHVFNNMSTFKQILVKGL